MSMENALKDEIVRRCTATIEDNAALLTRLDQAIGDGDHGINMARGFKALAEAYADHREDDFPQLCQSLGMALVMTMGGASGPLFGSLIIEFGRGSTDFPGTIAQTRAMLASGIEGVKRRGKSDANAKTMLDVLIPVCEMLADKAVSLADVRDCATQSLERTQGMLATMGRSAFLGERSIGHLDPGAQSSCLLIHAVCDAVEHVHEH